MKVSIKHSRLTGEYTIKDSALKEITQLCLDNLEEDKK